MGERATAMTAASAPSLPRCAQRNPRPETGRGNAEAGGPLLLARSSCRSGVAGTGSDEMLLRTYRGLCGIPESGSHRVGQPPRVFSARNSQSTKVRWFRLSLAKSVNFIVPPGPPPETLRPSSQEHLRADVSCGEQSPEAADSDPGSEAQPWRPDRPGPTR